MSMKTKHKDKTSLSGVVGTRGGTKARFGALQSRPETGQTAPGLPDSPAVRQRGENRETQKMKNRGNEAKKYLKTKEEG